MVIHAFFKRMLFLSTGSLMMQFSGSQDFRYFGGRIFREVSFVYFLVSCLCLGGFPFFLGFYSKDTIISSVSGVGGFLLFYFFIVGCLLTVLYSFRLI
jgi:NADH-quinone oxidoreductase subunit L